MSETEKLPKKRGRKPKKQQSLSTNTIKKNSEEEPIIAFLDIKSDDLLLSESLETNIDVTDDDIFLKNNLTNQDNNLIESTESANDMETQKCSSKTTKEEYISVLEDKIFNLKFELHKLNKNADIEINKTDFSKDTKCWWCKNCFDSETVTLPEYYFDEKFFCTGHFCSYNCTHSYNLDINDNFWKKNSLLHLLYYKTYNNNITITPAPHWTSLKEFGGNLTIKQFRKNSIINTTEYLMLKPPMDSRLNFFEKTYKQDNSIFSNTMYQKLLEDSNDLVIKRSKPIKSSNYSLDKTLFIKKKN